MRFLLTILPILMCLFASSQWDTVYINAECWGPSIYLNSDYNEKEILNVLEANGRKIEIESGWFYEHSICPKKYVESNRRFNTKKCRKFKELYELRGVLPRSQVNLYKRYSDSIYSRLSDTRVLILGNPSDHEGESWECERAETRLHQCEYFINLIDWRKFKNLKVLVLAGNDSDPLQELPKEIFELPLERIYLGNMQNGLSLWDQITEVMPEVRIKFIGFLDEREIKD